MDWDAIRDGNRAAVDFVFDGLKNDIEVLSQAMADCIRRGNKVMICGNGGSAADAQHFAAELLNRFLLDRAPYAGLALTTDTSVLTSVANDFSYDAVFEKQVRGLGREGDMLIAISTSGNAECVCRAAEAANETGIESVAFTGGTGGRLAEICRTVLCIGSSKVTARIQEAHEVIVHLVSERVEELLEA